MALGGQAPYIHLRQNLEGPATCRVRISQVKYTNRGGLRPVLVDGIPYECSSIEVHEDGYQYVRVPVANNTLKFPVFKAPFSRRPLFPKLHEPPLFTIEIEGECGCGRSLFAFEGMPPSVFHCTGCLAELRRDDYWPMLQNVFDLHPSGRFVEVNIQYAEYGRPDRYSSTSVIYAAQGKSSS